MRRRQGWWSGLVLYVGLVVLCACTGPGIASVSPATGDAPAGPPRTKSLTIGVTSAIPALGVAGGTNVIGGWGAMSEIHTDGLITSDVDVRRPIGRLAERVPSLDDGSIALLPDGRMRVVFTLRKGITWQDGVPFTAQDLVFTHQISGPDGLPESANRAAALMSSVEAPDDSTFVTYYRQPYYLGAVLGPLMFWPLPQHLLADAYARFAASKNPEDLFRDTYWTSDYVNTGAFRLTRFDPGVGLDFQAYDGYFLGRPKIDTIYLRIFNDDAVLLSSLLAGAVDLTPELALRQSVGVPLQQAWRSSGAGTVYVSDNAMRHLSPQVRPANQMEPAVLDPRIRAALYQALDRDALSDAVNGGNPQLAAWSILSASDPLYEVTRDTLRPFAYNPERARALLRDLGWAQRGDGTLANDADGRPFRTAIWASLGTDQEIAAYAAYWRTIGLAVDEHVVSAAESRDNSVRAQFPGWEVSSVDAVNMLGNRAATAENRWTGNRNGWEDPQSIRLSVAFKASVAPSERAQAMRALNEYFIDHMFSLPTYFQAVWIAERKGVKAFDDFAGGWGAQIGVNGYWGSYYRNAYRWDIQ